MMHKTCSINYGHLADLQKTLPTIDLNKKTFHLIKYLLATFIFVLSFQSVLVLSPIGQGEAWKPSSFVVGVKPHPMVGSGRYAEPITVKAPVVTK